MFRRVFLAAALSAAFATGARAATINYTAKLTGAKEVPKTASNGTGTLTSTYDTIAKTLAYSLTWEGLSGPATAAHFHGPANRRSNAGVIAAIGGADPTSPVNGTVALNDDQVKALQTGRVYVNIHTAANPGGEIRGQVVRGVGATQAAKKKSAT
jgi:hypothetical protein